MQHVMLDLYGCDTNLLADEEYIQKVLEDYPSVIHMERIFTKLSFISTSDPLDSGLSGFSIIATSHISLHAWPPYGMVNLDIFSCEDFRVEDAVDYAKTMFHPSDLELQVIERATRSPRLSKSARDGGYVHGPL